MSRMKRDRGIYMRALTVALLSAVTACGATTTGATSPNTSNETRDGKRVLTAKLVGNDVVATALIEQECRTIGPDSQATPWTTCSPRPDPHPRNLRLGVPGDDREFSPTVDSSTGQATFDLSAVKPSPELVNRHKVTVYRWGPRPANSDGSEENDTVDISACPAFASWQKAVAGGARGAQTFALSPDSSAPSHPQDSSSSGETLEGCLSRCKSGTHATITLCRNHVNATTAQCRELCEETCRNAYR